MTVLLYPHQGGAPEYVSLYLIISKKEKIIIKPYATTTKSTIARVLVQDIAEIRSYTELSYTFRKMKIPKGCEGTNHLLTIMSGTITISIATDSPKSCIYLVKGMKLLVEKSVPSHFMHRRGKDLLTGSKLMVLKNGKRKIGKFDYDI